MKHKPRIYLISPSGGVAYTRDAQAAAALEEAGYRRCTPEEYRRAQREVRGKDGRR